MTYNINGIEVREEVLDNYKNRLVDKIFAVLGIYEDCQSTGDFSPYYRYIDRLMTEFCGGYYIIGGEAFISISNILKGMRYAENETHSKVKSLVFHCISVVKKSIIKDGGA